MSAKVCATARLAGMLAALTVEAAGQVYIQLGGTAHVELTAGLAIPLVAMALTYYFANTLMIATAIALSTRQSVWQIWKSEFASSAPSYLLGAVSAAVVIAVTESSGYWLTLLLTSAPLYLTITPLDERRAGRTATIEEL